MSAPRLDWPLLLALTLAACSSDAEPNLVDAAGRELGPGNFVRDAGDGGEDAARDASDAAEVDATPDAPTGIGDPCRLLAPDDCLEGLKCVLRFDGTGECRLVAERTAGLGERCGRRGIDDCDAGQLCVSVDEESGLRCLSICNADTGGGCPDDQTCGAELPLVEEPAGVCL